MQNYCLFQPGDKVRRRSDRLDSTFSFPAEGLVISAVADLENPDQFVVDPAYWGWDQFKPYAEKTLLDIAGHPQIIFFDGILNQDGLSSGHRDGRGRSGFSGAWFEKC
jgi:hypothetical protein